MGCMQEDPKNSAATVSLLLVGFSATPFAQLFMPLLGPQSRVGEYYPCRCRFYYKTILLLGSNTETVRT